MTAKIISLYKTLHIEMAGCGFLCRSEPLFEPIMTRHVFGKIKSALSIGCSKTIGY